MSNLADWEEVAPGIARVAVRTPTLPPATHTNTYLAGTGRWTVFDPASPYDDEQARMWGLLRAGHGQVERIVLTHHHVDHVSGAEALRGQLAGVGQRVPIAAHRVTADLVAGDIQVDEVLEDDDVLTCAEVKLRCVFTPGHAPGHLVFHDEASGAVIAGDMVAGVGTILIDPMEGDLGHYLASLAKMQRLSPSVLLPSHGPALTEARALLGFYVAHRHQRTAQIHRALQRMGAATPMDLAAVVYKELPPQFLAFGAVQVLAHLNWMVDEGMVRAVGEDHFMATTSP